MLHTGNEPADSKPLVLLTVDEGKRARAKSDPTIVLPQIMVEDFSVPGHSAKADVPVNGLVIPQQRQRANTCPEEMFRKRRNRPPTPPPVGRKAGGPNRFVFKVPPKREPVSFVVHKLGKLAEDSESATFSSRRFSEDRYKNEAHRRKSCSDTRALRDMSFQPKFPLTDCSPRLSLRDTVPVRLPLTGKQEVSSCVSDKSCVLSDKSCVLSETCESTAVCSQGQEERGSCHPGECRYTSSLSRMDGTQLQAY